MTWNVNYSPLSGSQLTPVGAVLQAVGISPLSGLKMSPLVGAVQLAGVASTLSTAFSTSFPATENPISQGGAWIDGRVFGPNIKTACQSSSGEAYGTMVSFDGTNFVDSVTCLQGFGPNQEVTCTVANNSAVNGLETEVILRADITSTHMFLYEVDCQFSLKGINLVRWDMTTGSPNAFTVLRAGQSNEAPYANGDLVYASIVGTLITVKYKSGAGALTTLFTYDTASDGTKYSSGNPGVGFWNETGSAGNQNKFGWSNFVANTL